MNPVPAPPTPPAAPVVLPTHEAKILTIKINSADTAESLAQKYAGSVIVFRPEIGLAIVGTNSNNIPADALVEQNKPSLSSPMLQAQGWNAWASAWHAWSGGSTGATPSVGKENTFRWAIGHVVPALNMSKNLGAGIKVAVIDTGIDTTHPMFAGKLAPQNEWKDFVDNDADPSDSAGYAFGHGTGVAGFVLQTAPRASILPIRVLKGDGSGDVLSVIAGIDWAIQKGAQVINLSLGALDDVSALKTITEFAAQQGIYIVASAGNQGASSITYPAAYAKGAQDSHIISVGSIDSSSYITTFSNRSTDLEFAMPGETVYSAYPNNQIASYAGTSFSAPQLAGLLALGLADTDVVNAPKMQQFLQAASYAPLAADGVRRETFYLPNAALFLQKPSTWVASKEILFVVGAYTANATGTGSLNAGDTASRIRFRDLGYKVTAVLASAVQTSNATGKALVAISSSVNPTDVGTKFRDATVPVMVWQPNVYDEMGMTTNLVADQGFVSNETQTEIAYVQHPLVIGVGGLVCAAYTASHDLGWGKPNSNATVVATLRTDSTKALEFVYEPGTQMMGMVAPARRIGFYLSDAGATQTNWMTQFLFDEAVNYAVFGN